MFRHELEDFCIEKFVENNNIEVLCDGYLVKKLICEVCHQKFRQKDIELNNFEDEYIVRKMYNLLVCEPAKNENGIYKLIDSPNVIIVGNQDKLNSNYNEIKNIWILEEKKYGEMYNDYFIEFGER